MNYLTNVLPNHMKGSLSCLTVVKSKAVDGGPDIVICDTKGFVQEVKNKKILSTLNIGEKGVSICCSYLLENDVNVLHYTVLSEAHKLFVIKRTNKSLQIIKSFVCVKKFEVYDFECLGFPQIKISFLDEEDTLMWHFPVWKHERVNAKLCFDNETAGEHDMRYSSLADSLEDKLQILSKHIDELSEECSLLRKQCSSEELSVEFGMVSVGAVKFCLPLEKDAQPVVKVLDKWIKVFGTSLVLGVKIHNTGHECVSDVELLVEHEEIKAYAYRIFEGSREASKEAEEDLFSGRDGGRCVKGGGEVWVFGAFGVPGILWGSALSVTLCVMGGGRSRCLVRESFEVEVLEVVRQRSWDAEEELTEEDLMGARTLKVESHLAVHAEDVGAGEALEAVLRKELGLRKMKDVRGEMFCWSSSYLKEVLVGLREMEEKPSVWKMVLLTSEEAQVWVVVSALYEVLPERTRILCWEE